VEATSDAISPCRPASLATVLVLLSATSAYNPRPETNKSEVGRRRTNIR
jgi:hypothetical protein